MSPRESGVPDDFGLGRSPSGRALPACPSPSVRAAARFGSCPGEDGKDPGRTARCGGAVMYWMCRIYALSIAAQGSVTNLSPLERSALLPSLRKQETNMSIRDFHAHIYFDAGQLAEAQALAAEVQRRFAVPIGHFHTSAVGPHPRGSCQITVPTDRFGEVATWLSVNRAGLTIFAHASTGRRSRRSQLQRGLVRSERTARPDDLRLRPGRAAEKRAARFRAAPTDATGCTQWPRI